MPATARARRPGDRDFLAALLAWVRLATLHALVAIAVAVAAATTRATAVPSSFQRLPCWPSWPCCWRCCG